MGAVLSFSLLPVHQEGHPKLQTCGKPRQMRIDRYRNIRRCMHRYVSMRIDVETHRSIITDISLVSDLDLDLDLDLEFN